MRTARTSLIPALILALVQIFSGAVAQTVLPAQSEITFVFKQMGAPVTGRFTRFDARLALDMNNPEAGSVTFSVDTASATLGLPDIDMELTKPEWLASVDFPQAVFTSRRIRAVDAGRLEIVGTLSIKGITRELTVPVTLKTAADLTTASGSVTLQRTDFQVGQGDWSDPALVADAVQVSFRLVLQQQSQGVRS